MSETRLIQFPDPPALLHLIGIKGQAMTALAEILQKQGYSVTGSDTDEIFSTDYVLKRLNIHCAEGFRAENISSKLSAVIYSTAYPKDHIERQAARECGLPEWSYPEAAGMIMNLHEGAIAVAGSHGKTTTTALVAQMLQAGGFYPTAIVGGTVSGWGHNALVGSGPWFVLEADEYQNKLKYYAPRYAIITNIDYDHPDFFSDQQGYKQVFVDFVSKLPANGLLVICDEEESLLDLPKVCAANVLTYGSSPYSDWLLKDALILESGTHFSVMKRAVHFGDFILPQFGRHYALNALGAMALADFIGVKKTAIASALENFRGISRRFEFVGEYKGAVIIDDYAHHPTEIQATLAGLRARYPRRRLWCVFQAHTFSRTIAFLSDFARALDRADRVVVTPIYASAREKKSDKINNVIIAEAVNSLTPAKAEIASTLEEAAELLRRQIAKDDVVVTMGAGDIRRTAELIAQ